MLSAICRTLGNTSASYAINTYLTAAMAVGAKAPEADWLLMDYSDLVSAEANRAGDFGERLRIRLAWLEQHLKTSTTATAIGQLCGLLGDKIRPADAVTAIFHDESLLTEFLTTPCTTKLSDSHVDWLAFIIWFAQQGGGFSVSRGAAGLECNVYAHADSLQTNPLEVWIEQF